MKSSAVRSASARCLASLAFVLGLASPSTGLSSPGGSLDGAGSEVATKPRTDEAKPVDPGNKAIVTFTGFQQFDDQSSRIWVKLTRSVSVETAAEPRRVSYRLKDAAITTRNNTNPLVTKYFTSRITNARIELDHDDVLLSMELSEATAPTHLLHVEPGGGACFHVDFPPPSS